MKNFSILLCFALFALISARPSTKFSVNEGNRLIEVSDTEPAKWFTEEEINSLISKHVNFMDITGRNYPAVPFSPSPRAFPGSVQYQSTVRGTFSRIDQNRMRSFITEFSSYTNRYYNAQLGAISSEWVLSQVSQSIAESGYRGNATVRRFDHSWVQPSVIARIQGSQSGVVILGAHQDSINSGNPVNGVAPGADDNASGSVALLEILRVILASGVVPKNSIEFQWYAAEEVGLRGSQDIAVNYLNTGVDVISMLNFDVVGYNVGTNKVSFMTDSTDPGLTQFLRLVVEAYLDFTWQNYTCGYGCSDHVSWYRNGFPAAASFEAVWFPSMHTNRDVIANVNFAQVAEFVKLGLGYIIELGEPVL